MTQEREKVIFIDVLKSFACLCVVLGHVIKGLRKEPIEVAGILTVISNFVYFFHVPCFFFASGYLYANKPPKSGEEYRKMVWKKLVSLGVPYFACSVFYILTGPILSTDIKIYSLQGTVKELLTAPVAQYWYLYALFEMFVLVPLVEYIFRRVDQGWILFLFVAAALVIRADIYWIKYLLLYTCYFYLGVYFNQKSVLKRYPVYKIHPCRLFVLSAALAIGVYTFYQCVLDEIITNGSVNYAIGGMVKLLLVVCMALMAVAIAQKDNTVGILLIRIAPYSLYIYLFHTWFTGSARVLLCKMGFYSDWLHLLCGMAVGVFCPVAATWIIRKVPFFQFWFEPLKVQFHDKSN
jgi:fucose 4-O-acetylase-like acetyltransferase